MEVSYLIFDCCQLFDEHTRMHSGAEIVVVRMSAYRRCISGRTFDSRETAQVVGVMTAAVSKRSVPGSRDIYYAAYVSARKICSNLC